MVFSVIAITISILNILPILNMQSHSQYFCDCNYPLCKDLIFDVVMPYNNLWVFKGFEQNPKSNLLLKITRFFSPNLQIKCDHFLQTFSVCHALSCSNRGLIVTRHNMICDKIIHPVIQSLSLHCVRIKPLIHKDRRRSEGGVRHGGMITETWGGVLIRGL